MAPLIITNKNADEQIIERLNRLGPIENEAIPGCLPRTVPYGHIPAAVPAEFFFPIIPRKHWKNLIENDGGPWLHNLCQDSLPPHDQGGTNYCWAHGSVRAVEVLRVYQSQMPLILSAESIAVPLTGGRNRGGTPDEALGQLMRFGACRQELWPLNDRNESHADPRWKEDRLDHVVIDWLDIPSWDYQMTLALHRIPIAIGLAWWGHLVCQLDPVILPNGEIGIGFDNSWGADYGENGYAILDEKHGTSDLGAFAPISGTFGTIDAERNL